MIEEVSDALVVLPMDHLFAMADPQAPLADAIPRAEAVFSAALTLSGACCSRPVSSRSTPTR